MSTSVINTTTTTTNNSPSISEQSPSTQPPPTPPITDSNANTNSSQIIDNVPMAEQQQQQQESSNPNTSSTITSAPNSSSSSSILMATSSSNASGSSVQASSTPSTSLGGQPTSVVVSGPGSSNSSSGQLAGTSQQQQQQQQPGPSGVGTPPAASSISILWTGGNRSSSSSSTTSTVTTTPPSNQQAAQLYLVNICASSSSSSSSASSSSSSTTDLQTTTATSAYPEWRKRILVQDLIQPDNNNNASANNNNNNNNPNNSSSSLIVNKQRKLLHPSSPYSNQNNNNNNPNNQDTLLTSSKKTSQWNQLVEDALSLRQKLEQRLNGILCCAVCLYLPKSSVYQCPNGHLMCAGCFTHVLADARLRDESPTCPNCRISISKESCSRNLAVEKAVCELPGECRYCQRELPRSMLDKHMNEICEERIVPCKFANIGCPWYGPFHEADYHATNCLHPNKSAREVLDHLEEQERKKMDERKVYETLFTLLSYEKISFHDVQFRPYRTDEYIHKLFYETSRFTAFNLQWVIKARVNDDQRDPTQSCERHLSFQLCLKSKIQNSMTINYMLLKGPYGEAKVMPMIYKYDFSESQTESNYNIIQLASSADSNRLLAARLINFRLIMFQASK